MILRGPEIHFIVFQIVCKAVYFLFRAKEVSNVLPYEIKRANELHQMVVGSPASEKPQLVIDLHNTTSNMGCTLILTNTRNIFSMHLAAYVKVRLYRPTLYFLQHFVLS